MVTVVHTHMDEEVIATTEEEELRHLQLGTNLDREDRLHKCDCSTSRDDCSKTASNRRTTPKILVYAVDISENSGLSSSLRLFKFWRARVYRYLRILGRVLERKDYLVSWSVNLCLVSGVGMVCRSGFHRGVLMSRVVVTDHMHFEVSGSGFIDFLGELLEPD